MSARKSFIADTGGAILIAGVFMTFFLIGGLFFLLGIGKAMVYHDHMQEVADVSAFTGAVVHARFMNMIAGINIIMLALAAVHILIGIVHLALLVANAITCIMPSCETVVPYPPFIPGYLKCVKSGKDLASVTKVYDQYDSLMMKALKALSKVQFVLAKTAFVAAPLASLYVADNYTDLPGGAKVKGVSEGLSIPYLGGSGKLGLPVKEENPDFLCQKLMGEIVDFIPAMPDFIKSALGAILGGTVKFIFCSGNLDKIPSWKWACQIPTKYFEGTAGNKDSGTWWENDKKRGPKHMWEYSGTPLGNGSDYNSVYGLAFPKYTEDSEKSVAVGGAAGAAGLGFNTANNSYTNQTPYFAQAEFYYDCTHKWDDAKCEGDVDNDNAMYTIGWRARLVRFHLPRVGMGSVLASMLNPLISLVVIH